MPWVDELSEPDVLKRCIRDLVALSTLPAIWKEADPRQIADSVAAALLSMLNADFVHVARLELPDESTVEVTRMTRAASLGSSPVIERMLYGAWPGRGDQVFVIDNPLRKGTLRITAVPMGIGGDAVIIAGSSSPQFPTEIHRLLLGIAANDATIALQRWHAEAERRRLMALIEQTPEFIGFASLDGKPRYLNAAGCELLGSAVRAMKAGAVDFIEKPFSDKALIAAIESALKSGLKKNQTDEIAAAVTLINTLSPRERQVLDALVTGHANKIIAFELGISVRTVEVHRARMMDRLGVRQLGEAVRLAVLSKLIEEG